MDSFVYGALTEPEQVERVVDSYAFLGPAVLSGLHPIQGESPTLAPGDETGGRLLRTDEIAALDSYEGIDDGLYVRISVPFAQTDGTVEVYVGDPLQLGIAEPVGWPGHADSEPFAERVERYLREHEVCIHRRHE